MKIKLIILACAFITPFAFGQHKSDDTTGGPTTMVPSSDGKMGTVASFVGGSTITLSSTALTHPAKYRVAKDVKFVNTGGNTASAGSVRPGTKVSLGFNAEGQVDEIKLLDLR